AGEYFIILEDLLGRGGGEFGYLLSVDLPRPDFVATITRDTPIVRRGGRVPIRCEVNRVNGFAGPVTILAQDLPSGVYAEPLLLPNGINAGFLVLNASGDAPLGSFPLRVNARAIVGGRAAASHPCAVLNGDKPVQGAFLTILDSA